jgi:hypothetical protein
MSTVGDTGAGAPRKTSGSLEQGFLRSLLQRQLRGRESASPPLVSGLASTFCADESLACQVRLCPGEWFSAVRDSDVWEFPGRMGILLTDHRDTARPRNVFAEGCARLKPSPGRWPERKARRFPAASVCAVLLLRLVIRIRVD